MKRLVFFSCALILVTSCATAPSSKPPSAKERYADELMSIVPPETMIAQLAYPHAASYTLPSKQEKAHSNFMRNVDVAAVDRIIREALLKHFTEAELQALVAFYSTPEGRACMAKVAPFAADVVPACSHEATKAFGKTARDAARGMLFP